MEDYSSHLKSNSQKNRNHSSDAQQKLWQHLRHQQIFDAQFNHQKTIDHFIVDFYCEKAKLVIEINAAQHFDTMQRFKDTIRDDKLRGLGLKVLRFNNKQVLLKTEAVVEVIYGVVGKRLKN